MLLDSVIVIDHLNGREEATAFIREHQKKIRLSVITRAEVLAGCRPELLVATRELLNFFPTLPLTQAEADLAAALRQQYRWKLPDAFQAALALQGKMPLVTRNTKDFSSELSFVMIPYVL